MLRACAATACPLLVKPARFMCPRHWRLLPPPLQQWLWSTFRQGQPPSPAYGRAALEAIRLVARLEQRTPDPARFEPARPPARRIARRRVVCGACGEQGHNRLRHRTAEA